MQSANTTQILGSSAHIVWAPVPRLGDQTRVSARTHLLQVSASPPGRAHPPVRHASCVTLSAPRDLAQAPPPKKKAICRNNQDLDYWAKGNFT